MTTTLPPTFPYFEGKTILYVHGFASSGQTGTARSLATMLPKARILAPDLPTEPLEVMPLLRSLVEQEQPALIIGTSMGGFFAEQLYGTPRILVNPAFKIAETIRTSPSMGLGRHEFLNPRRDGQKDFLVTKRTIEDFRQASLHSFEQAPADGGIVFGLFGRHDPVVHTQPIFARHYRHAIWFEGEHRLNDSVLIHAIMPIVRRLSDRLEGRQRPIVYADLDTTLRKPNGQPVSEAAFAFETLAQGYDMYVVVPESWHTAPTWAETQLWVEQHLGTAAYDRLVISSHKQLLLGDYFIDASPCPDSLCTTLKFGEDPFKTWRDVLTYFERLGGQ